MLKRKENTYNPYDFHPKKNAKEKKIEENVSRSAIGYD